MKKFASPMLTNTALQELHSSYFKKQLLLCNATQLYNAMNSLEPSYDKHFALKFKHFV